jgi:hypothetical protein
VVFSEKPWPHESIPGPGCCGLPEAAGYLPQQPPPREKNKMQMTAAIARMVNQFIDHVLGEFWAYLLILKHFPRSASFPAK